MTGELAALDATAQAELVRSGEASPSELVEAAIERAESVDPELNALIHERFESALADAAGEVADGPFRGVPIAIKDLGAGCLAGDPLHMGMRALKETDFRAPMDTYLGLRFRDAGFVSIGRTNVPELGILPTTEPDAYGACRNPWDSARSTGGSSGGAAASVAAGIVPVAHASDGGGSIRIPASCCGLVGLKPTRQRISEGPLLGDFAGGLNAQGAVTRSVRDAAAVLDAIEGPAPGDPYVAPPPARPYVEELDADPGGLRIGVMTEALVDIDVDDQVAAAARDAAAALESLGHAIDEEVPALPADDGGGEPSPGTDPREAFITRYDASQAQTLDQLSVVLGRPLGPDDVEPLTWAMAEGGRRRNSGDYLAAVGLHQMITRLIAAWFDAGHDLLLTPTMAELPPALGSFDDSGADPLDAFERALPMGAFTAIFNFTGQPAISLPLGTSSEGLPIGVQLVAPYGREDILIRVAAQVEQAHPWADRRPPVWAGVEQPA